MATVVLRDTCDVLIEITKVGMCLNLQHGKSVAYADRLAKIFLSAFAVSFVINQLYFYPLFCLYHALNLAKVYNIRSATMVGMLTCGLVFLLLDLVWFTVGSRRPFVRFRLL